MIEQVIFDLIFASLYAKLDKPFHALCLVFFAYVTVETTQLLIGRVFDIDDIILNVIGAMLGYLVYRLFDFLKTKFSRLLKESKILVDYRSPLLFFGENFLKLE